MEKHTIHELSTSRYQFYPEDYTDFTTTQPAEKKHKNIDWLDEIKRKNELALKIAIETQQNCNHNHRSLTNDIFRLVGQVNTLKNEVKQLRDEVEYFKKK
jgi:hypothetical protein